MNALNTIKKYLLEQKELNNERFNYVIPDIWVTNQDSSTLKNVGDGNVMINPYDFMIHQVESIINESEQRHLNYQQPYYSYNDVPFDLTNGDWIKQSIVYSMMVRTSTSYDHDRSGKLEASNLYDLKDTGTFLKTLLILPYLKEMGIDTLYLLPISKFSFKDKKGEAGSPYGVSNFFKVDHNLKDPLTGDECDVEVEFKALVEAAHIMGMKVVIDIIPRTNSVNSDFILDYPEWFYWVKRESLADYKPPFVPTIKEAVVADKKYFKDVFESEEVINHLKKFTKNPKEIDPVKWEEMLAYHQQHPEMEVLDLVDKFFGMAVAYAFSDNINDPQPAWTDITYFRMYLDHPANSQPYLDQLDFVPEPYLLFDVAKSSLNPGNIPNEPLWNVLSEIIPFYQREFGIDGARIDMGHALPLDLVNRIITKAKAVDPNFCFIAEELDVKNAAPSIEKGYNMIIGDGFTRLPFVDEYKYNEFVYTAKDLVAPVFACGETHDTPRLAARPGHKITAKFITLFNFFIPNAIPFINSGQEFYEIAPMNLGIGARENEQFLLEKDDPYYGKLALFDFVSFHMNYKDRFELMNEIKAVLPIREKYLEAYLDKERSHPIDFDHTMIRGVGYAFENEETCLLAICHNNFYHDDILRIHLKNIPDRFKENVSYKQLYSSHGHNDQTLETQNDIMTLYVKKGEVKLIEITKTN